METADICQTEGKPVSLSMTRSAPGSWYAVTDGADEGINGDQKNDGRPSLDKEQLTLTA
jgi:hypothetical protein